MTDDVAECDLQVIRSGGKQEVGGVAKVQRGRGTGERGVMAAKQDDTSTSSG